MLKDVAGLIIADDQRIQLGELARQRALSAVPFGGRYRLIDFMLSNMVNSGIRVIGISTYNKYKSLMDHLGTGSAWDLDRKNGGLFFLPPYVNAETMTGAAGNDLSGVLGFYRDLKQRYVLVSSSTFVINTTLDELMDFHLAKKADISVMYNRDGEREGTRKLILDLARNGKVKTVYENPMQPVTNRQALGVMIMERELFVNVLAEAIARGEKRIDFDYFLKLCDRMNVFAMEYKGCALRFTSVRNYFSATMAVLTDTVRKPLLESELPVYTKVKDEAPTYYSDSCIVNNSMISDGCLIQGTVNNSMIFRGVTIGPQSKLRNCIVFQDTQISEACDLENVIIDKDCIIRPGIKLIGQEAYPVVIGKGAVV